MHASRQLRRPNVDRRPKLTEISRLISAMPMIIRNDRITLLTNLAGQNNIIAIGHACMPVGRHIMHVHLELI